MSSTCVLVIGPHRSGTSALSGVLELLGVDFNRPPAGWPVFNSNAKGQVGEDPGFVQWCDRTTGNWRCPQSEIILNERLDELRSLISDRKHKPLWGLKDPRLCLFGSNVVTELRAQGVTPKIAVITRPVQESAASLSKREPGTLPLAVSMHIICDYWTKMLATLGHCEHNGVRMMITTYKKLLADPRATADACGKLLGFELSDEQRDAAERWIEPALQHWEVEVVGA